MKSSPAAISLLQVIDIDEFKSMLKEMKDVFQEKIDTDPDYDGSADVLMFAIQNLEEELSTVTNDNHADVDGRKQVRILADMSFLQSIGPNFDVEDDHEHCHFDGGCC